MMKNENHGVKNSIKIGVRYEKNGWIYLSTKGTPKERGYANGFLMAPELKNVFKMLDFNFMYGSGYSLNFFSEVISGLYGPQIKENYPEYYEEMEGVQEGAKANHTNLSLADIIMWNCYLSIDSMINVLSDLLVNVPKLKAKYLGQQIIF